MRTRTFATLFALTAALGLSACDKKEDKPADKKAEAKKTDEKADAKTDVKADDAKADGGEAAADGGEPAADGGGEPAAAGPVELAKLGLKGDAPAGTNVSDAIVGEGQMVQGPNLMLTVEEASDTRPKTEEDATKEADMYTPKNLKTEKLEDGWAMTFDNEGSMGANFFVQVRREIGGKAYWCETTASSAEQQTAALDFCKSLKQ
ncbi:hypothetical protein [Paraliomyxa miuraensis]|uniref:hypothetical protein n=1 Tax=Paraliomyxa miuraensis TaxID=376150 RepID=UPI0022536AAD|nr:hypothetical protein [Paraliomyxa miuraensis]MCX4240983.1 hypothetical protein [Paraliomyxa miuraensis]